MPIGLAERRARGLRPDPDRPLLHGAARAGRRRPAAAGRHLGRGRRPALAAPAGHGDRRRERREDEPRAGRRGGLGHVRHRRRGRGAHLARLLRRPRRAGRARRRRRGADAVRQAAGARRAGRRGEDRGRRPPAARRVRAAARTLRLKRGPMAEELVMPRLSDTMERGTIARWLKQEGDHGRERRRARRDEIAWTTIITIACFNIVCFHIPVRYLGSGC